jgi:hypothetical protein
VATSLPLSLGIGNVLTGQNVRADDFVTAALAVGALVAAALAGTYDSSISATCRWELQVEIVKEHQHKTSRLATA